ncbi:MAG: aspartate aminotransferase family protein [Flavobacteriaceae bacterium]
MSLYQVYAQYPITIVSANGMQLVDDKGETYLDYYGGHAVISVGHGHPHYTQALHDQLDRIAFYSNVIENPLQVELDQRINAHLEEPYQLFMCSTGAEANENAMKLASFKTQRKKILAFKNSFHGRTSAAVAATDSPKIWAPLNTGHEVDFVPFEDLEKCEQLLSSRAYAAVIIETVQGVGGLDQPSIEFAKGLQQLCEAHGSMLIADEVQSGFGRTGAFFSFQRFGLSPDIISMAKGMGNGFPVAGIMVKQQYQAVQGELGTTFGGNFLACRAALAVIDIIENENLIAHAKRLEQVFRKAVSEASLPATIKGAGLMIGLDFKTPTAELRKKLLFEDHLFVGSSSNPNVVRILPALTIDQEAIIHLVSCIKKHCA